MSILAIVSFILVLSILVLVHELGHFIMAKRAGVWVEEFGFGIPPRIFGKKIGETIYSINALPFGGFVRLHGENPEEEEVTDTKRSFMTKSKKTRASILVAGVIMNFLLAILAFTVVYSFSGIPRETDKVKVVDITPGSPAQTAGILSGDTVVKVNNKVIKSNNDFMSEVESNKGKKVAITVSRDNGTKTISVTPRKNPPEGEGPLGVVISTTEIYYPPIWQRPFVGVYYGFKEAVFWGKTVLTGFAQIFQQLFKGQAPQDLAGPVGIFAITSQATKAGILVLINFVGVLSVNLAILNVLPFPALDGGRLFFVGLEGLLGKRILPKVENYAHMVGMVILIGLLLAVTASDIRRLIQAGGINGFINTFLQR